MILCVNREEMVGIDYESVTGILKKTEGVINMWVCNPVRAGEKPAKGMKGLAKKPGMLELDLFLLYATSSYFFQDYFELSFSLFGDGDSGRRVYILLPR